VGRGRRMLQRWPVCRLDCWWSPRDEEKPRVVAVGWEFSFFVFCCNTYFWWG
jgi:hypothetical protein